jgi:hypothetical protein
MAFPRTINVTQAPGVEGDFASANPRHSALSVAGGFLAGPAGLTIGRFAWADPTGTLLSNTGTGAPTCFIHRAEQAVIIGWLDEFSMTIPPGLEVGEMFDGGDFFARNAGVTAASRGMKAYASLADGSISFAATGATVAGSAETGFYAATPAAATELVKITTTVTQ